MLSAGLSTPKHIGAHLLTVSQPQHKGNFFLITVWKNYMLHDIFAFLWPLNTYRPTVYYASKITNTDFIHLAFLRRCHLSRDVISITFVMHEYIFYTMWIFSVTWLWGNNILTWFEPGFVLHQPSTFHMASEKGNIWFTLPKISSKYISWWTFEV